MTKRDLRQQLNSLVEKILSDYGFDAFENYWELSQEIIGDMPVRKFYVLGEPGYINVAILTNHFMIDIEGEEEDPPGSFELYPLSTIESVRFHEGPIDTLPGSSDAELILLVSLTGSTEAGPYWIAETTEEKEYLIQFGKSIIESLTTL